MPKSVRTHIWPFILVQALFCCILLGFHWSFGREEAHLWINKFHSPFFDFFFKYITYIGGGFVAIVLLAGSLLKNLKWFGVLAVSIVGASLTTLSLKHVIFDHVMRPSAVLENQLKLVEGVVMNAYNSFPSGHTTSSFAIFCSIALIAQKKSWSLLLVIGAVLAGFSRVYLSQHFFEDVAVGSMIGTSWSILGYWTLSKINPIILPNAGLYQILTKKKRE